MLNANSIVPELMTDYLTDATFKGMAIFRSGLVVPNQTINASITDGGEIVTVPYFNDLSGDSEVMSDTTDVTLNDITTKKQRGQIQFRRTAFRASDLAASTSGSDPVGAIQEGLARYWNKEFNKVLANSVQGVIASDLADEAKIVNDQSAVAISEDLIIDTLAQAGENMNDFAAVIMDPSTYTKLLKDELITTVQPANVLPFETYRGMVVIVDSTMAPSAGAIHTIVFAKPGSFAFGENSASVTPFEIARNADRGIDIIHTRRRFVLHPQGTDWLDASVAGVSATNAELATAENWDVLFDAEKTGFVALKCLLA